MEKRKRCPNGTRKNKITGECEKKNKTVIRKRCPNGTRKNKITGECEKTIKKIRAPLATKKSKFKFYETPTDKQDPTHFSNLKTFHKREIPSELSYHSNTSFGGKIMLMYILQKHKNDCLLYSKDDKDIYINPRIYKTDKALIKLGLKRESKFEIIIQTRDDKSTVMSLPGKTPDKFREKLYNCKTKNGLLMIPILLLITKIKHKLVNNKKKEYTAVVAAHQNMLIINIRQETAERFEPHGIWADGFGGISGHQLDIIFRNMFTGHGLKYIPPAGVCPSRRGLQLRFKPNVKELGKQNGIIFRKPGGYCLAWSYFYADARLTYPDLTPVELLKKCLETDPKIAQNFINGYITFQAKVITKYVNYIINRDFSYKSAPEKTRLRSSILEFYNGIRKVKQVNKEDWRAIAFIEQDLSKQMMKYSTLV